MDWAECWNHVEDYFGRVSAWAGVVWAPRRLPAERRLQTLAAAGWVALVLVGEALCALLFVRLLYSRFWLAALAYGVFMLRDVDVCHAGGRRFEWVRNWVYWKYYCDYFPIKLEKTTELDPSKNYLFACFPHGVISLGACGAFGTNALGFHKLFPGLTSYFITLSGHFLVPFFRDFLLALGACSSSERSLLHLLDLKKFQGNCVALIVGGAAEALDAHPGEYKVILKRRKGFIRVALKTGAPLVPVFSFGEPDAFRPLNNPEHSWLRKFQEKFRQVTGVSPVFPIGRGMLQYSYGVVPLRAPITIVVGAPIEVARNLDPSDAEVDELHARFERELCRLFDAEKGRHPRATGAHLRVS